jgi:hypothetical protein
MSPVVIGDEHYPGPETQTDEEIIEYIRKNVMTLWHPSCTNKMGTPDDPTAVIDSKARVFGVNRLRVVDASSFPFLPPGHPQSSVCKFVLFFASGVGMLIIIRRHVGREDCRRYYSRVRNQSCDLSERPNEWVFYYCYYNQFDYALSSQDDGT